MADLSPTPEEDVIAGRYSLEREIGRGGTGVVWLGRDEVLGRQVALKRIGLLPGADETDLARAAREAQLSARIHHENVVAVFDAVVDEHDARWLVMEYVDGQTLAALVRQHGALSPDVAAPLLRQVADALVAAHAAGIAHRDVKPSNALVDRTGRVKLSDFGIARISTDATLTQTGFVTGSPAYLSPEVASGGRGDAASDVWSLGATAYHLLTGHPPYEVGDNVLGALYRIVQDEPPRLPDAGWLAPLIAGTLTKDPAQRWTMEQVRAFLGGAPAPAAAHVVPAPAEEPTQRIVAARASRRWRTPLVVALAVVLLIVLGVGGYALLHDGSPSPRTPTASGASSQAPQAAKGPTSAGMKSFIDDYVTTVADDPSKSWPMLTAKFQRESGGFAKYQSFWNAATDGHVTSITADPDSLVVSYQVHFDDFDNGPGPTVLQLTYDDGTYKIDGETTKGFTPAS